MKRMINYLYRNWLKPLLLKKHSIIILAFVTFACAENETPEPATVDNYTIEGSAQKGPFINGSDIVIYELNGIYSQTGKSFTTNTNAYGEFQFDNIELSSPYIEILAEGFYFNEVSGELSNARLSLKGITNISSKENINVNILTHLEYERVKFLITHNNLTIQEAKDEARTDLLSVFSIQENIINNAEKLDILGDSPGDAILLAISAIIQGNNTTSGLSKLLADFVSDIKEDGVLNDTTMLAQLKGQAMALNCNQIGNNLLNKCEELNIDVSAINNFNDYVDQFIENTNVNYSSPFTFPETTSNGSNVLNPSVFNFQPMVGYAFAVDMPGEGDVEIVIKKTGGDGYWYYEPTHAFGWKVAGFNNNSQTFTSRENNTTIDLPMEFSENGEATIEYYYNGAVEPSMVKNITWELPSNNEFVFPNNSPAGLNILNMQDSSHIKTDTSYTVGIQKAGLWDVNFKLYYNDDLHVDVKDGYGIYSYTNLDSPIEFKLSGISDDDNDISEIVFRFTGTGELHLFSDELNANGASLFKIIYVD